jgi:hypothetical protein
MQDTTLPTTENEVRPAFFFFIAELARVRFEFETPAIA